jgi:hypothetical protein
MNSWVSRDNYAVYHTGILGCPANCQRGKDQMEIQMKIRTTPEMIIGEGKTKCKGIINNVIM